MAEPRLTIRGDSDSSVRASNESREALARLRAEAGTASKALGGLAASDKAVVREQTRVAAAHSRANGELGRATRGALAGSGAFHALGRSVAFASASFLGAAGFTAVVRDAISKAEHLDDVLDRSAVVFRGHAKQIQTWAGTTAASFGFARSEALDFANEVGTRFRALGFAGAQVSSFSKNIVQLSRDIGELQSKDPAEFIGAFDAALSGRTRGLKQFGIFIDDARIKAEALREGLVKTATDTTQVALAQDRVAISQAKLRDAQSKYGANTVQVHQAQDALRVAEDRLQKSLAGKTIELTEAQKAEVIYQLVLKQSADAQGFYAKQSGDADVETQRLRATVSNLEEDLGTALLPTVSKVAGAVADWLSKSENQERIQRDLHQAVKAVTDAVRETWPEIRNAAHWVNEVVQGMGGWNSAIKIYLGYKIASKVLAERGALRTLMGTLTGLTKNQWKINLQLVGAAAIGLLLRKLQEQLDQLTGQGGTPAGLVPVGKGVTYDPTRDLFHPKGGERSNLFLSYKQAADALGISVDALRKKIAGLKRDMATSAAAATTAIQPPTAALTGGKAVQIPTHQPQPGDVGYHITSGLPTFPAVDIMAKPGTPILAPEDGAVTRISGHEPSLPPPQGQGGPWGLSIYYVGTETGNSYYLTHLMKVAQPGHYRKGDVIGIIGDYPGSDADHVHVGIATGRSPETSYGSGLFAPGDYLASPRSAPAAPRTTTSTTTAASAGRGADKGPATPLRVGTTAHVRSVSIREQLDKAFGVRATKAERTTKRVSDDLSVIAAELRWIDEQLGNRRISAADRLDLEQLKTDLLGRAADLEKQQHDKQATAASKLAAEFKRQQEAPGPSRQRQAGEAGRPGRGDIGALDVAAHRGVIDQVLATNEAAAKRTRDQEKKAREAQKKMYAGLSSDLHEALDQNKAMMKRVGDDLNAALDRAIAVAKAKAKDLAAGLRLSRPILSELKNLPDDVMLTVGSDLFGRPIRTSVAKARDRIAELVKVIKTGSAAARAAAIEELGQIAPAVGEALDAAKQAAQDALAKAQGEFQRLFERVASRVLAAFDRETQSGIDAMQKTAQAQIDALQTTASAQIDELTKANEAQVKQMQTDLQARVDEITRQTDAALKRLSDQADARIQAVQDRFSAAILAAQTAGQALTPAEQALKDLQEQHDAEARARDLADAQKQLEQARFSGDPEAIKAAEQRLAEIAYDERVRELQKEADAERAAQDKQTDAKVKALQDQQAAAEKAIREETTAREQAIRDEADARETALREAEQRREEALAAELADRTQTINDELAARVEAINSETATRVQGYQDERDVQRDMLADQLTDWENHLLAREADWTSFVTWLQGTTGDFQSLGEGTGGAFGQAFRDELTRAGLGFLTVLGAGSATNASIRDLIRDAIAGGRNVTPGDVAGYQHGGVVPGRRGRGRIILAHGGERVLSDRDQRVLARTLAGGAPRVDGRDLARPSSGYQGGVSVSVQIINPVLLGRDEAVARRISRLVEPHLKRRLIGFDAYNG